MSDNLKELLQNPTAVLKRYADRRVFYFFGPEAFLIEQAVKRLTEAVVGKPTAFNTRRFDAQDCKPADVLDACENLPFGAAQQLVSVRSADELSAEELELLVPFFDRPAAETYLLFWGGEKIDSRRKFFKVMKEKGVLIEAAASKGQDLQSWISFLAKKRNVELDTGVPFILETLVGNSLFQLDQALEKLGLFAGSENCITQAMVWENLADTNEGIVWGLTDALGANKGREALSVLGRLLRQKDSGLAVQVVGALANFYRRLLYIQSAQSLKISDQELMRQAGLSPGALFMNRKIAGRFSVPQLKSSIGLVSRADRSIKSSGMPGEAVLRSLVLDLLGGATSASRD